MRILTEMGFWILFTDESKFNLFDYMMVVQEYGGKKNTAMQIENLLPTVKQGGGSVFLKVLWTNINAKVHCNKIRGLCGVLGPWGWLDFNTRQ